jgi:hypothetical protein
MGFQGFFSNYSNSQYGILGAQISHRRAKNWPKISTIFHFGRIFAGFSKYDRHAPIHIENCWVSLRKSRFAV